MRDTLSAKTVDLFVTCFVDSFYPQAGQAAVGVLEENAMDVRFNPRQTCCGQFAFNAGYHDETGKLACHLIEVFEESQTPIVALSGSCAAMVVHEYPRFLKQYFSYDTELANLWSERADVVGRRMLEFSQMVNQGEESPVKQTSYSNDAVVIHTGCHMRRILKEEEAPQNLVECMGARVVALEDADQCCGFGGTFSVVEPEVAAAMADSKISAMMDAQQQGARCLVGTDMGCLLHLKGRLLQRGLEMPIFYLAEWMQNRRGRP